MTTRAKSNQTTGVSCNACFVEMAFVHCSAILGRVTFANPRQLNGEDVIGMYRLGAHSDPCLRYKNRMTPSAQAEVWYLRLERLYYAI